LEPLQPLIQKYINFLEAEVLPSTSEHSRPRLQLKRADIWLGFKSLYVSLTQNLLLMYSKHHTCYFVDLVLQPWVS